MDSEENVADSQEHIFDSLSSTNERLIEEMNEFLASMMSSNSPGESGRATGKADFGPEEGGGRAGATGGGARKKSPSLVPIDEDGGRFDRVEYCCDDDYFQPSPTPANDDDDSVVAMARRMDAASIVSDPSLLCGPSERRLLALPQPAKIAAGVKKLLPQRKATESKPEQPPRPIPRATGRSNPQRFDVEGLVERRVSSMTADSSTKGGHVALSQGSPSSSKENVDLRFAEGGYCNDKSRRSSLSSDSAKSSELDHDGGDAPLETGPDEVTMQVQMHNGRHKDAPKHMDGRARRRRSQRRNRKSHLSSGAPVDGAQIPEELAPEAATTAANQAYAHIDSHGPDEITMKNDRLNSFSHEDAPRRVNDMAERQRSGRKNKKSRSPSSTPATTEVLSDDNGQKTEERAPEITKTGPDHRASAHKSTPKSGRNRKMANKKSRSKRNERGNDDSMQGIGFNTRIHDTLDVGRKLDKVAATKMTSDDDSMRGIGFNTRIHDKPADDGRESDGAPEPKPDGAPGRANGRASPEGSDGDGACESDARTEIFYESTDDSVYDSDDQTQIFYESTDDEGSESCEGPSLSVAQAVEDLNSRRAVTKVKNIFGIRG